MAELPSIPTTGSWFDLLLLPNHAPGSLPEPPLSARMRVFKAGS